MSPSTVLKYSSDLLYLSVFDILLLHSIIEMLYLLLNSSCYF